MAKTSVDIPQLKFNKMSTAKYEELKSAGQLNNNEFYITPDGGTIPEVNEITNDFVLSNNGTDLNWVQETEYTKNRIDSKLNDNVRTNCLTKIPQDIKLELIDGTLTLKAGSKVYIPNGFEEDGTTPKFDEIIIDVDKIRTKDSSLYDINNTLFFYTQSIDFIDFFPTVRIYSGDTEPDVESYDLWYDITENLIKTNIEKVWTTRNTSLPFCIGNTNITNGIININQIFNGFGYIGNTWYVLPGVNVLIPNGFDSNKNYNNINLTIPDVRIYTSTIDKSGYLVIQETNVVSDIIKDIQTREEAKEDGHYYIINENKHYYYFNNMWIPALRANVGKITYNETGGVISFNPQNVFQAVSKNDTNWVSTQCKPSNRYVDLTLQASGTSYTAPANGIVYINKIGNANQFINLINVTKDFGVNNVTSASTFGLLCLLPVSKGDVFRIDYNLNGNTDIFRFIYDEGAK